MHIHAHVAIRRAARVRGLAGERPPGLRRGHRGHRLPAALARAAKHAGGRPKFDANAAARAELGLSADAGRDAVS